MRYSLDRYLKMSKRNADLGPVQKIEVVGGSSVRLTFQRPFAALFTALDSSYLGIVSKAAAEKAGDELGRRPVGSGPYTLKDWKAGSTLLFARNAGYRNLRGRRREQGRALPRRVADLHRQRGRDADGCPRDRPAPHVVGAVRGGAPHPEGPAAPARSAAQGRLLHLPGVQHQEAALRQARPPEGDRLLGGLQGGPRRLLPLRHRHPGAAPAGRRPASPPRSAASTATAGTRRRPRPSSRRPATRREPTASSTTARASRSGSR